MSYDSFLISQATVWDVSQSTALGISESTSFSDTIDCRIQERSGGEQMSADRETNISSHIIFVKSTTSVNNKNQLVSAGNIYHVKNVSNVYGKSGIHHIKVSADLIS